MQNFSQLIIGHRVIRSLGEPRDHLDPPVSVSSRVLALVRMV